MRNLNYIRLFAIAFVAATAAGCGSPTAAVSGTVTDKEGKPVTGIIAFMPQDGAKYREAVEGPIVDGQYDLPDLSVGSKWINVIVTRNGVSDPSLDVTASPKDVDLQAGPQKIDITLSRLK